MNRKPRAPSKAYLEKIRAHNAADRSMLPDPFLEGITAKANEMRASQKDIPIVSNATAEERISALEIHSRRLEDRVVELQTQLTTLTKAYNSHHHPYYNGGMSEPCAIHQVK